MEQIQLNNTLPNQSIEFIIEDNIIELIFRTTKNGLFCDLKINDNPIFYGKRCVNLMPLLTVNNNIKGNLYFKDLYNNEDPFFEEFNKRFILIYDANFTII